MLSMEGLVTRGSSSGLYEAMLSSSCLSVPAGNGGSSACAKKVTQSCPCMTSHIHAPMCFGHRLQKKPLWPCSTVDLPAESGSYRWRTDRGHCTAHRRDRCEFCLRYYSAGFCVRRHDAFPSDGAPCGPCVAEPPAMT
jgi:hypothetical protein